MLSFLHRWDYWWKCEFETDVKIENFCNHDGEELLFDKKVHKGCSCNLYMIARNEEFQFLWLKLYSRERQMRYSAWKKIDLEES